MMTSTSYLLALLIYITAALVGARLIKQLLFSGFSHRLGCTLTGLIAGLLLVPSFASIEASTLAPALVTALFNLLFAGGLEAAMPALVMLFLGAIAGCAAGLVWGRLSTSRLEEH